ncbi:MAG: ABC transporter ATP-binding protein, partial [Chloroflexaceae bacterium]|nr:ABC transporter ATP-binding protein [Chloroflexaceae bacterium]
PRLGCCLNRCPPAARMRLLRPSRERSIDPILLYDASKTRRLLRYGDAASCCNPALLIADEPTTALDVTIQAQILDLMRALRTGIDTSIILITHDMGVVAEMAENVAVMYAGQIVEYADVVQLFADPKHPYTQGLLKSIPVLGRVREQLDVIEGVVPNLINPPAGCRFASRCPHRFEHCSQDPPVIMFDAQRQVRCWLYAQE